MLVKIAEKNLSKNTAYVIWLWASSLLLKQSSIRLLGRTRDSSLTNQGLVLSKYVRKKLLKGFLVVKVLSLEDIKS